MGSMLSLLASTGSASSEPPLEPGLGHLPESCVASVLVHLEPPQICRLAMLNRAFRGASSADFVWESKLPVNYGDVIGRVFNDDASFSKGLCKKDVYSRLCRANSFDGGTKKVWLDKSIGKMCMSVSSNGLAITGIDDRRYWSRIPTEESRLQLGRANKRFGRRVCNPEHVHGWDKKPVRFQLSTSDGQQATKQCYLKEQGRWINYHAGDFAVPKSCSSMKVKFSMTQIDCTHTKGGLCVDSVVIYPAEYRERLQVF